MKLYPLHGGDQMPALGLGTWKFDSGQGQNIIREAIKIGYRHFDCASRYENEKEIGQTAICPFCGIDSVIGDRSGVPITKEFLSGMNQVWF